jgi:hypothetical protein
MQVVVWTGIAIGGSREVVQNFLTVFALVIVKIV